MVRPPHKYISKHTPPQAGTPYKPVGRDSIDEACALWGLRRDYPFVQAVADFYLLYDAHCDKPEIRPKLEEHSKVLAAQMSAYMNASSGGELRHLGHRQWHEPRLPDFIRTYLSRCTGSRPQAWILWHEYWSEYGEKALEALVTGFSLRWGGALGGQKWRLVVENLLDYIRGGRTTIVFVDTACNIEHNCGPVFNKLWSVGNIRTVYRAAFNGDMLAMKSYASEEVRRIWDGR